MPAEFEVDTQVTTLVLDQLQSPFNPGQNVGFLLGEFSRNLCQGWVVIVFSPSLCHCRRNRSPIRTI